MICPFVSLLRGEAWAFKLRKESEEAAADASHSRFLSDNWIKRRKNSLLDTHDSGFSTFRFCLALEYSVQKNQDNVPVDDGKFVKPASQPQSPPRP